MRDTNLKPVSFTQYISWASCIILVISAFGCETASEEVLEAKQANDPVSTEGVIYKVGEAGPAGGLVFYDKGEYIDDWRYLEAAPSDLAQPQWGCFDTSVSDARQSGIGSGLSNSEAILAFHDNLDNFYGNPSTCSEISNGTVAAKECLSLVIESFDNWHLPSEEESYLMYQNLHLNGLGNFNEEFLYWTSTEHDNNTAPATDFSTGSQGYLCKQCSEVTSVRAVRYF